MMGVISLRFRFLTQPMTYFPFSFRTGRSGTFTSLQRYRQGMPSLIRRGSLLVIGLLTGAVGLTHAADIVPIAVRPEALTGKVQFNRDLRPILSDTCFHCHGPDKSSRKGGLRLDIREMALGEGKSGELAIVPGKPMESEIIRRILSDDPDELMPPEEAHKTLSKDQKELFRRWVEQGAEYEAHWAYTPLVKPVVPASQTSVNTIDGFIQAELGKHNIKPSAQASKRDLLRRLSLDLTGLPPTPAEMAEFMTDDSQDAYIKQVDRLLLSPRYGERMTVWWMDVARFTDTVGYHGDQNQRIFPYRDYVINAFNNNKSFKDFTIEQLAGDLLPNPTTEQLVATGFNRLNMMTREGGAQPKEYLSKYGGERARTVGTTWLGSTFGCAECHDHKFDPISQKDFYALQAYFADVKQWGVYSDYKYSPEPELVGFSNEHPFPPEIQVDSPYRRHRAARLLTDMQRIAVEVASHKEASAADFETWKKASVEFLKHHADGWAIKTPTVKSVPAAAKGADAKAGKEQPVPITTVDNDGRVLFVNTVADNTTMTIKPGAGWVSSVRLELLPMNAVGGSIARHGSKDAMNLKFSLGWTPVSTKKFESLPLAFADADRKKIRYSNGAEILGVAELWVTDTKAWNQTHTAVLQLQKPVKFTAEDTLTLTLQQNLAACIRIAVSPFGVRPESGSQQLASLRADSPVDEAHQAWLLSTGWDATALQRHQKMYREWLEQGDGKAWTMITQSVSDPLTVRLLPRGNWIDESGEITPPATPEFLPVSFKDKQGVQAPNNDQRLNRLQLAEWLCSDENPLTARAVMNRLWKEFFGNGLSRVVDDLGAQGEAPSHPELMDWLASEFRDSNWDVKHMIRLMVTSSTYMQSSNLRLELRDLDPDNRLLASQNPRRLEAEFVRDNALFISGLLNLDDIGGPSAKPYQPGGYYANLQFPDRDYLADDNDQQWRRGLYMHWQRTFLHPMLANFDAPSREECTALRPQSNTPQQALTLLNDPTFVEAARVFAQSLLADAKGDDYTRLNAAFHRTLGRAASDKETTGLLNLLDSQRKYFSQNPADAEAVLHEGLARDAVSAAPSEQAAWAMVCRVLLNLHETITRY